MVSYTAVFRAVADYGSAISSGAKLAGSFVKVDAAAAKAGTSGLSFGQKVMQGARLAQKHSLATGKAMTIGITLPLAVAGTAAVRTFANFESAIVSAGAKSDATAAQLQRMTKVALEVGNRTKFSATQAAGALDLLAAAGFNAEEAIGTLPAVTAAAQAANEDLGLTALVTAKAMNAFNIPVSKAAHVADVFTNALNSTALNMQGLQDALGQVGEIGPRFNQTLEDTVAVIGRLVDMGVPAASAGTAVRQALTSLAAPTAQAGKLIGALGIHLREADGTMKPLPDLVREVQNALKSGSPQIAKYKELIGLNNAELRNWAKQNGFSVRAAQQMQQAIQNGGKAFSDYAMRQLFGVEGAKAFALAMSDGKPVMIDVSTELEKMARLTQGLTIKLGKEGADAFIKAHTAAGKFSATGADAVQVVAALGLASDGMAKKIGAAFQKTTLQKIDNLKGSIETLAIVLVQKAAPALNKATDRLTRFITAASSFADAHPGMAKFILTLLGVVAAVGPVLIVMSKLNAAVTLIGTTFPKTAGLIGKGGAVIGKGTAALVALYLALQAAGAITREFRKNFVADIDATNKALLTLAANGDKTNLDNLFKISDKAGFKGGEGVDSLNAALHRLGQNSAIDKLDAKIGGLIGVTTVLSAIKDQFAALDESMSTLPTEVAQRGFKQVADAAKLQGVPMAELVKLFPQYAETVRQAGRAQGFTFTSAEQLGAAMTGKLPAGLKMVNGLMVSSTATADQLAAAQGRVATKEELAAEQTNLLKTAHGQLRDAENKLSTAIQDVVNKFTVLRGGTLNAQEASDNYKQSLHDQANALKAGTGAWSDNTQKGRDNRAVIRGLIKDLAASAEATFHHAYETSKATTESGRLKDATAAAAKKLGVGRAELIKIAEKAGVNNKAFRLMIAQMLLTPKEIKTKASADVASAKAEVRKLKEEIKKIKTQLANIELKFKDNAKGVAAGVATAFKIPPDWNKRGLAGGGEVPGRAGGGEVRGRGGPRQDNIAGIDRKTKRQSIWVSAKEFVVNAKAYARNRQLVRDINAGKLESGGDIPKAAMGGQIQTGRQHGRLNSGPAHRTKIGVSGRSNKAPKGRGSIDDWAIVGSSGRASKLAGRYADVIGSIVSKGIAKALAAKAAAAAAAAGGGGGPVGKGGYVSALAYARRNRGHRYIYGSLWDCSGFISALHSIILGQRPHRRYSTPAFHGAHAAGFTRGKRSPFMVGVNPSPGKSGHMAGTLNGVNVESAGGVGVRVGGGARGWNNRMFSWRGGLKAGGEIRPPKQGDLPYDLINPKGQRYNPELAAIARALYGDAFRKGGKVRTSGVHLFGETGPELARTRPGTNVLTSKKTLDYLSRVEAMAAGAPASLASLASAAPGRVRLPSQQDTQNARPIMIMVDLGDGVTQKIQGVLDEHDEFHASIRRAH